MKLSDKSFKVKNYFGNIFFYTGNSRKFMNNTVNFNVGYCSARQS